MFTNIPGAGQIFYTYSGSGPPILLLHPIGLNADFWDEIIPDLSLKYTVIALDFRGHGRSESPDHPYSLDDLAKDILSFCRIMEFEQITLCGLSMGGMVAQIVALKEPSLVSALVLANTTAKTNPKTIMQRANQVKSGGMESILDDTLNRWFTKDTLKNKTEIVHKIKQRLLSTNPKMHAWAWQAIAEMDVQDQLNTITIPCLVISGEQDQSTSPSIAKGMIESIPIAEYFEIPEASHMSVLEQPEIFVNGVLSFLKRSLK